MRSALRAYLRTVVAISVLVALALTASYTILQGQRLRIPILEERPFELRAELSTAQAVEPGQGQTIRVAGVPIGDVAEVELEGGTAIVTFAIERRFLPIHRDATLLMRPQTGLKDMFFELDPGTRAAGEYAEGRTIPVTNTLPDINLDEVLAVLDADSRAYLRLLVTGLGQGLEGRARDLGAALGSLGSVNRDFERLGSVLAARDRELARLVHDLNLLSGAVGARDDDLAELVGAANAALGAIAVNSADVERFTAELPGTLAVARRSLADTTPFAAQLGPALDALRPFARRLRAIADSGRELAERATPALRDGLRPLARAALPLVPDLSVAARRYAAAAPRLEKIGGKVNELGNMTAYNPRGAEPPGTPGRDEGHLYWLGWFAHAGNSVFTGQDAHGVYRRLYLTGSCSNLAELLELSPSGPVVGGLLTGLGPLFEPGGACER